MPPQKRRARPRPRPSSARSVPLAARIIPRVAPAIMRAAPRLIRGLTRATRTLRRSPATRQLVRVLPSVMRRTATVLGRQAASGQPVTPRTAVRTLARETAQVIGRPLTVPRLIGGPWSWTGGIIEWGHLVDRRLAHGRGHARRLAPAPPCDREAGAADGRAMRPTCGRPSM